MRIVILTSIYRPEPIVGAQTAFSLARELASRGHKVIIVTSFPSRPAGKLFPGYRRRLYQKEHDPSGFEVLRCFSIPSSKSTLWSRFAENITFGLTSAGYLLFSRKVDVVYANTWFLFAAGLMSLTMRIRRTPYILRVTDLYPESLVSQKRTVSKSLVFRFLRRIDQWISRGASCVTVLTPQFAKTYIEDRKIEASKVAITPDWFDEDDLDTEEKDECRAIRQRFGIPESSFLAAYGGNVGAAAGVETLVKAGDLLPDVPILIAGDGSHLCDCRALASHLTLPNVFFFSPWPKEQTMALYGAADVLVLPTRGEQSTASIPSKLIRYMLSGRPVIAAGLPGTELTRIMEESQCGWVISPDDPNALAQSIQQAKSVSQEERAQRGAAGRAFAQRNFSRKVNLQRLVSIVEDTSTYRK